MTRAFHAEWTKLRTSRETWRLLAAVAVLTVAVSGLVTDALPCGSPAAGCGDVVKTSLIGVQLGQAVVAVLGVLIVAGEYTTGMVHVTFAAMPRREFVLAAKAMALTVVVAAAAVVGVAGSLLVSSLPLDGVHSGLLIRASIGSVLYLVLIALLSLGVATCVRDSAAAIGLALGMLYLSPIMALAINDPDWRRHLEQVAPTSAGLAIQATTGLTELPIGPWAGLGVLAAWTGGALVLGWLSLRLRDA
jgi:ABC-2 type transport system permease protein